MARLTAAERNALPDSDFAGPNRTYPVEDAGHAKAAKGRASEFAGPALKAKIGRKVRAKFGFADGGNVKKDSENEKEAEGSAAEEKGESKAEERAEKRAGKDRKGFSDGGIASARDKLNLKPTPGDEGPANDKRDHPMSASMKSALKGYPNLS